MNNKDIETIKDAMEYIKDWQHKDGMSVLQEVADDALKAITRLSAAGEVGDPVAWQVYNPLVKGWTSVYSDKPKADQLAADGYKIRPLYSQPAQPDPEREKALEALAGIKEYAGMSEVWQTKHHAEFDADYETVRKYIGGGE